MFKTLTDSKQFERGETQIWYGKTAYMRDASLGSKMSKYRAMPTLATLEETHCKLGEIADTDLETIFHKLQGEIWSPEGEARDLIGSLDDVWHTSMSVGDVVVIDGTAYLVDMLGFTELA